LRVAQRNLAARRRDEVVASLSATVDDWLAPDSRWLAQAVALLPDATGFSAPMIRTALPMMLDALRAPGLADVVQREAGERRGPALILHILPGNLPGLAAIPAALSLAVGSAALLKEGRGDRIFPALFVASLAARDPELAACLRTLYWPGGDRACEDVALAAADLVVASGDDASIADIAGRSRTRFIGHGHRISFAVVTQAQVHAEGTAAALARDVAIWDQRGCLSPQLCFVEGGFADARAFATRISGQLSRLVEELPPATLPLGDRLAVRRCRDEAEWMTFDGEHSEAMTWGDEATGTVLLEPRPRFCPSPLGRTLRVMPIPSFEALEVLLAPYRGVLEGAALAAETDSWGALADRLRQSGVHLVSAPGAMQRPPLDWRQGGRPRLADWLDGDAA
jgi:hypothetical protein